MKTKVQNWTKMSICHRTLNHKKIWNVPLDALICPLQIINDIEPLSLTLHGLNARFIYHPSNLENYSIGHKLETGQPKKKKKVHQIHIFIHLSAHFELKIQNTHRYRNFWIFSTSGQSALNGPANGPEVRYSKIQNRLSRPSYDTPMDWFLMQYINNKCALILRESVKKVVLDFRRPIAPP